MKTKPFKLLLLYVTALGMTFFTHASTAGDRPDFDLLVKKLVKQYNIEAQSADKEITITNDAALSACATGLKNAGYDLSSLLVAPSIAGGSGTDARSWPPGDIKSEVCVLLPADDGTTASPVLIKMCIREHN